MICSNTLGPGQVCRNGIAPRFLRTIGRLRSLTRTGRAFVRALVGSFSAAKQVVLGGRALSVAIHSQIERELSEGLLVRLPYEAPWLSINYGFITKPARTPSPAAKAFMAIVRSIESQISQ